MTQDQHKDASMDSELPFNETVDLDDTVVAKIVALAARDIRGIRSLGKSQRVPIGNKATRGVAVEVGRLEAAIDLELVVEYGVDIRKLAAELRQKVFEHVDRMANRKVVEVNIHVSGIAVPEEHKKEVRARVQ